MALERALLLLQYTCHRCRRRDTNAADPQIREDTDAEQLPRGTRVTLHLKEDAAEYADDKKLGALIKQYSEFIAFPIKLWAKRWVPPDPVLFRLDWLHM